MLNSFPGALLARLATGLVAFLAAILMVAMCVGCSDGAPAATAPPSTETADAVPATLESTPAPTPATAVPSPTETIKSSTPTPEPTAAVTLQPSPPTDVQYVSEEHRAASERVFALVEELIEELGHREAGSPEELQAAEHLKERLDAIGYPAEIQPFSFEFFDIARYMQTRGENAKVVVESPMQTEFPGLPLTTTPAGGMDFGSLVAVGQGRSEDFPEGGLAGNVVLIQPGDVALDDAQTLRTLLEKVSAAAEAGAVGAVISGNITGLNRFAPLLAAESTIPALVLPAGAMGEQLASMTGAGDVTVSVSIETEEMRSQNVVAELEGSGDGLVIVGGHYDVVPQTEAGANDNTSGIAIVLALAESLADQELPFTVRFIAFGAEETGLFGSSHYIESLSDEERASIKAMLNFDVVASGDLLAATGEDGLTELALKVAAKLGVKSENQPLPAWASSDHQPFVNAGVPVLLLYGPDVSRIHTPQDLVEFVQPERLGAAFLVAEGVLKYAEFPK